MKKTYKDYKKIYIGTSDRAELTLRFDSYEKRAIDHRALHFGGDNTYEAYLIQDEDIEIPKHYHLAFEHNGTWIDIIDDMSVISFRQLDKIKIYRAGDYGCIICLKHLK